MDKDAITEEVFEAYNKVRRSGVTNMFDVKTVTLLSRISREECFCIMTHYNYLLNKFNNKGDEKND